MSLPPFKWMQGDPANFLDRLRLLRKRMEAEEKRLKEVELKNKRRRIRRLLKQAKARQLKGQK
jgi:hypothetical protein